MQSNDDRDCVLIRSHEAYDSKQGLPVFAGISRESARASAICMHLLSIPPGGRAKTHYHEQHETAIYVLSGEAEMWYGHDLEKHMDIKAGEFLYIPPGMPHVPANKSATEPCTAVLARTDPNEQESVVLVPEFDKQLPPVE